ncbi:MAG: helix-turn-helix domain-containing protein [Bacteroidetes bacterium]|nr:helix-turn-helix domain-containing protein [Bacteroidota bacterium]
MQRTNTHIQSLHQYNKVETLVENRTAYTTDEAELNIYETFEIAERVDLTFDYPVFVSMISGKKVMHFNGQLPMPFVPHESLLLPPGETMRIDFPEATVNNPTRCLALAFSPDVVKETLNLLNEKYARLPETGDWKMPGNNFYLLHDLAINDSVHRMVTLFTDGSRARNVLTNLALKELIVRVLQTEARNMLLSGCENPNLDHRLTAAITYVRGHLHEDISLDQLCRKANMSKPNFFRQFKIHFGITPTDFINRERIQRAKQVLAQPFKSVTDASFSAGFNNLNYFTKVFKKVEGVTPSSYKKKMMGVA